VRRLGIGGALLLVLLGTAYLCRATLLTGMASFLVVSTDDPAAGYAFIWDGAGRFDDAAELHRSGRVGALLIAQRKPDRLTRLGISPPSDELARRELGKRGVPPAALSTIPGEVTDDWSTARQLTAWLRRHPGATVVVIGNRFRTRERRHMCAEVAERNEASRILWHPLAARGFDDATWWRCKAGLLEVPSSWVGFAYTLTAGPRPETWHEWEPEEWLGRLAERAPADRREPAVGGAVTGSPRVQRDEPKTAAQ
jgi:hypothetical protein